MIDISKAMKDLIVKWTREKLEKEQGFTKDGIHIEDHVRFIRTSKEKPTSNKLDGGKDGRT